MAVISRYCGGHSEAIDEHQRARQLDRFSLIANAKLARSLNWGHRYDEAIGQAKKTLQMDPNFFVACSGWRARCATKACSTRRSRYVRLCIRRRPRLSSTPS